MFGLCEIKREKEMKADGYVRGGNGGLYRRMQRIGRREWCVSSQS